MAQADIQHKMATESGSTILVTVNINANSAGSESPCWLDGRHTCDGLSRLGQPLGGTVWVWLTEGKAHPNCLVN